MIRKGGMIAWLGLAGLLVLGGCATPGERQAQGEQPPAQQDGPPLEGEQAEGATAEGLGAGEGAESAALEGQQAKAGPSEPGEHRVFFDFDSAQLSDQARELIRSHADFLKANPGTQVTLEGHADERGSREYNLALAERRAKSVRRIMLVHGVDSERLKVVSFGEEQPLVEGHDEDAYSRNRRVKLDYDRSQTQG